jgi:sec-independent protein translocase protein TatB
MFGMGFGELLMIALIALLFVGPEKLPGAAKTISKGIRDLRKSTKDLQQTIEQDTQLGTAMREIKSALRGDDVRMAPRPPGATGTGAAKPTTPSISAKAATKPGDATAPTADGAPAATPAADGTPASPEPPATSETVASAPPETTAAPARGSDGDDVSELAARLIRPAPSSVPQAAKPAAPDAHDADGPGTPAAGSGSAHG